MKRRTVDVQSFLQPNVIHKVVKGFYIVDRCQTVYVSVVTALF